MPHIEKAQSSKYYCTKSENVILRDWNCFMHMLILFPWVNTVHVDHCILKKNKVSLKKSLHFSLVVNPAKSPDKDKN